MGTPIPKVYAWSSNAKESAIGAEYIIMEKVPGVPLDEMWPKLQTRDRYEIVKTVAGYQKAWTSFRFKQFGCLYYAQDIEKHTKEPLCVEMEGVESRYPKFAVGPSTARENVDAGRLGVEFDRGPCKLCRDPSRFVRLTQP